MNTLNLFRIILLITININFLLFCCDFIYFSEDGQDKYVNEKLIHNKKEGFFVDIGAHGGILHSNTYFFEKFLDWRGICFEPNPPVFRELIKHRKALCLQAAIGPKTEKALFIQHNIDWVSGLYDFYSPVHKKKWKVEEALANNQARLINVQCYNLIELLQSKGINHVDLLSIDTEGSELAILNSIDFDAITFDVIVVENIYDEKEYMEYLDSKGFTFLKRLHRDQIYKRKNFDDGLDLSPN